MKNEQYEELICPQCNGSGEGMYDGTKCFLCGGAGVEYVLPEEEQIEPRTLTKETLQSAIDCFDDLIENPDRVLEIQPHPRSPIPVRLKNCKELSLLEYLKLKEEGKIK